jgi:hypothetical protein
MLDRSGVGESCGWLLQTYEGMKRIESSIVVGCETDGENLNLNRGSVVRAPPPLKERWTGLEAIQEDHCHAELVSASIRTSPLSWV